MSKNFLLILWEIDIMQLCSIKQILLSIAKIVDVIAKINYTSTTRKKNCEDI